MNGRPFDWTDFLGQHRTIAIHTPILVWTGDYHAAALFEELVWRWNTNDREAFTVTDAELMAKLYMTRGALRGARARLVELGAVGTVKRGIPPVLHYTVDPYAMNAPVEPTLVQFQPNDDAILAQPRVEIEPTYIQSGTESRQSNGFPAAPDAAGAPLDADLPTLNHGQAVPTASDQTGKATKNGREPKPPRTARGGAAPRVPMGDGCQLYRDIMKRTPNDNQRPVLDAAHAEHGADRMREAFMWWSMHGYNPGNVPDMLSVLASGSDKAPNGYARNGNGRAAPDFSQVIL